MDAALHAAARSETGGSPWPYAVLLGPDTVTLRLAGTAQGQPPPSWRRVAGGWATDRELLEARQATADSEIDRSNATYVALGWSPDEELVLLDLARAPGILGISGDPLAVTRLACILLVQLEPAARAGLSFLVCDSSDEETMADLNQMIAVEPTLRAIVLCETRGSRWPLTAHADGTVTSTLLGLTVSTDDLPSALGASSGAPSAAVQDVPVPLMPAPALAEIRVVGGSGAGQVWTLSMGQHTVGFTSDCAAQLEWVTESPDERAPAHHVRLTVSPDGDVLLALPSQTPVIPPDDPGPTFPALSLHTIRPAQAPVISPSDGWVEASEHRWPEGGDLHIGRSVLRLYRPVRPASGERVRRDVVIIPELPVTPAPPWSRRTVDTGVVSLPEFVRSVRAWRAGRRSFESALSAYRAGLPTAIAQVEEAMLAEWAALCAHAPDPAAVGQWLIDGVSLSGFPSPVPSPNVGPSSGLVLRVGSVETFSKTRVVRAGARTGEADPLAGRWILPGVPYCEDLTAQGMLTVCGPPEVARPLAHWLVAQASIAGASGAATPDIRVFSEHEAMEDWDWVNRLPRVSTPGSPAAVNARDARRAVEDLAAEIGERSARSRIHPRRPTLAVFDRATSFRGAALLRVLTEGPAVGVYSICVDATLESPVIECGRVIFCDAGAATVTACSRDGEMRESIVPDLVTVEWCERIAAALSGLRHRALRFP